MSDGDARVSDPLDDPNELLTAKINARFLARTVATLKVAAWLVAKHRLRQALHGEPSPAEVRQYAESLAQRSDIDLRAEMATIPEKELLRDLATDAELRWLSADAGLPELRETTAPAAPPSPKDSPPSRDKFPQYEQLYRDAIGDLKRDHVRLTWLAVAVRIANEQGDTLDPSTLRRWVQRDHLPKPWEV